MIKICGKIPKYEKLIRRFVRWLNRKHPIKGKVNLRIFGDRILAEETLDLWNAVYEEGDESFGMYDDETGTILLPVGGVDETLALFNLAHEVRHAFQHAEGKRFREQDADAWASQRMLEWQNGE